MYPAHIRENGERQTVQEHCRNTAALAAAALRPLGLEKSAYLAGLLHDAGKNKQEYAQYLSEAVSGGNAVRGSVNHTFAGVRLLLDRWHGGCGTFSYSADEDSTYYADSDMYDGVSYKVFELDDDVLVWGDEGAYYLME